MQELVTVIIPVYNTERMLERAAESALTQSYANIEIIIVDDGSTDRSGEIADRLAEEHANIRVYHTEEKGVSAARNLGLSQAKGAFLTFLDADDALDEYLVEKLVAVHHRTGADICGCMFSGQNSRKKADGGTHTQTGREIIEKSILRDHDTRVWSKLFTRESIGDHRFDEELTIGEDTLFFLSLIDRKTTYTLLDDRLYLYTVNPEGAMEKPFVPSYMDQLRCWEKVRADITERFPHLLEDNRTAAMLAAVQVISAVLTASKIARLPRAQQDEYRDYFEQCRDSAAHYRATREVERHLPVSYRGKAFLLTGWPAAFCCFYTMLRGRKRHST
ncbi:heptose III glucuronosyltransferase [Lachnospiraceae bacterium NK3A20]|nr:heptose III glucuronosyltransferase [Lachnospiraceae bacterium NK3A20]